MRYIDVAMIAANTDRSKVYLQALLQYGICPSYVIIMMDDSIKILSNSNSGLDDYAVANKFCYLANRYSWGSL